MMHGVHINIPSNQIVDIHLLFFFFSFFLLALYISLPLSQITMHGIILLAWVNWSPSLDGYMSLAQPMSLQFLGKDHQLQRKVPYPLELCNRSYLGNTVPETTLDNQCIPLVLSLLIVNLLYIYIWTWDIVYIGILWVMNQYIFCYLLSNLEGVRGVAFALSINATHTVRISKACKLNRFNYFVIWTSKMSS